MNEIRTSCTNCESPLSGKYCHDCGQKDFRLLRPIWSLIEDALGDLFAFDSRFYHSIGPLFVKPGYVTKQFIQGKRASFVPPFRQYLVISIIFFLTLALSNLIIFDVEKAWEDIQRQKTATTLSNDQEAKQNGDLDNTSHAKTDLSKQTTKPEKVTVERSGVVDAIDSVIEKMEEDYGKQVDSLNKNQDTLFNFIIDFLYGVKKVASDPSALNKLFADWVPKLMFFMLPFFALLLKIVYIRRKKFYIEHLIFALHLHAFIFLLLTSLLLAHQFVTFTRPILPWLLAYIPIYLIIAMRHTYDQSFARTITKGSIVGLVYFLIMGSCIALAILYGMSNV